jgi:DNA-binding MarR family transcriptional regulator
MEATGLVSRHPDLRDRRLVRIHLTERGRQLEDVLDKEMRELSERALASMSGDQRQALIGFLNQIRQNLT